MDRFAQLTLDGIGTGSIYALAALAIVLIFRSTGLVNLAQGEMATFSTFLAWQLTEWGLGVWVALALTMAVSFAGGMLVHLVVIRPVQRASELTIVIVTLGLYLGFNSLAGWIWGHVLKSFPSAFPSGVVAVGDVRLTGDTIGIVVSLLVLAGLLFTFFRFTRLGLAMRTVAYNVETSRLVGIRVNRMLMMGWGLSAAIGAAAGVFVAPKLFLDPNLMGGVLIYAIAAAALGGLDSPLGAVVGGISIGIAENLAGSYIGFVGTDLKILVPLAAIVIILLFRPAGLFGSAQVTRV